MLIICLWLYVQRNWVLFTLQPKSLNNCILLVKNLQMDSIFKWIASLNTSDSKMLVRIANSDCEDPDKMPYNISSKSTLFALTIRILKQRNTVLLDKSVQIQIRLLLKKQSDKGLPCLLFYSDKHFVISSIDTQHFIQEVKEKSVRFFRIFTV